MQMLLLNSAGTVLLQCSLGMGCNEIMKAPSPVIELQLGILPVVNKNLCTEAVEQD